MELSRKTWLITSLSPGGGEKMSKHLVPAGDVFGLLRRFAELRRKAAARTGQDFPVIVIQEAGLDGFWIHRVLQSEGIESHVVNAASILTSRRRRRAKTDRIDGETLVRTLMAFKRGEPRVCSVETYGTADKVTLSEAQKQARGSFTLAREGVNPVEQRKQKLAGAQATAAGQAFTFDKLAQRYMREYVERNCRPSTAKQARRLLARAAQTFTHTGKGLGQGQHSFGELPASVISRSDIDAVIETCLASKTARAEKAATGGLVEANRLLGTLQRCFKWGRRLRLIETDPTLDMPMPLKTVPTRDRFLTDDEIVAFWHGCDEIGYPFGPLFKLLLLTGQRLSEVAGMPWNELGDLAARTWSLPKERTKNEKAHQIHLSDLAITILESLPRFTSGFVFRSERGDGPVVTVGHAKKKVMEQMSARHWQLHDLRRTMTTGMASLGIPPHVADKILNHKKGTISGVMAIYQRFEFLDERKAALDRWGQHVEALVYPERAQTNVVDLRAVAAQMIPA